MQFSNPAGGKSKEYQGVGFQIENIAGLQLTPIVVARNVGTTAATVTTRVPYTRIDGTKGIIVLPQRQLAAGEMNLINTQSIVTRVQQEQIKVASLEVEYNTVAGSIIVAAHSVSSDGNQVFRVPLWDPLNQRSPTGGYPWYIEDTSVTETYIRNITDQEQDYVAFLTWENGGMYMIGLKSIAGRETVHIDVRRLRDEQIPDERGRVIPLSLSSGQLQWTLRRKDNLSDDDVKANLALIGRSEQVDVTKGIANNYACQNCCSGDFVTGRIEPANLSQGGQSMEVGTSRIYIAVEEQKTCYGGVFQFTEPTIVSANWTSNNNNVATVAGGRVDAVAPGNATITASWYPRTAIVYPCGGGGNPLTIEESEKCEETEKEVETKEKDNEEPVDLAPCGTCVLRRWQHPFTANAYIEVIPRVIVTIKRDNNPVTSTQDVVVGQQIKLSVAVEGGTPSNIQWSIPGIRIANYELNCPAGPRCTSGRVFELGNLNNQNVDFYWVDGGDGRQVSVSLTVGNRQFSKEATFNVAKPTVNLTRVLGQVRVRLEEDDWWLRFGGEDQAGIDFVASSFSGPQGNRAFVQIANAVRRIQLPSGNWCRANLVGLDGAYPYPGSTIGTAEDSPGNTISGLSRATANDSFQMYYMFRPTGVSGSTIWVPLKVVNWGWSGEAETTKGDPPYRLVTSAKNADPAAETTNFPQWTTNAEDGVFVPENGTHQCPN